MLSLLVPHCWREHFLFQNDFQAKYHYDKAQRNAISHDNRPAPAQYAVYHPQAEATKK